MRYLVWDTEALHAKPQDMTWGEYRKVSGISVAATIDEEGLPMFYTPNDRGEYDILALADALESAELTVGYNTLGYDYVILNTILGRPVSPRHEVDLYDEIRRELHGEWWPKGSWTLGRVAYDTLGVTKTGEGAHAPVLWQAGHFGELFTYVFRDVWLARKLFEHILEHEWVLKPNGERLAVHLDL